MKASSRKDTAAGLKLAAAYLFFRQRYSCAFEVGLKAWGRRRADIVANKISGALVIVEVKSSVSDFSQDRKWKEYRPYADKMYLCFTRDVWKKIKAREDLAARIPKSVGVITLQESGYAKVIKKARKREVELDTRLNMLARLAWRAGDLSKRKRRSRERVFLSDSGKACK